MKKYFKKFYNRFFKYSNIFNIISSLTKLLFMKIIYKAAYILWVFMFFLSCDNQKVSHKEYTSVSSQTQLTDHEEKLKALPDDPVAIANCKQTNDPS
ncbi:MAG: hypothetical protein GY936_16770 [Ignavibacteriae bacterium]|nr:hypothetical protein [Ignavibacteriota bacterium]